MARGNNKRQAALTAIKLPEDDRSEYKGEFGAPSMPDFRSKAVDLVSRIQKDKDLYDRLYNFLSASGTYQGDSHFLNKGTHKERRQEIVEAFKALPDDIRKMLDVPKDHLKDLYRGADHATNPGPNGSIVASFTTAKGHAEGFGPGGLFWKENKSRGITKAPSGKKLYTAKDIDSIEGIIDFSSVAKLHNSVQLAINSLEERSPKPSQWADSHQELDKMRDRTLKYGILFGGVAQREFLVHGIKWREGVK